MKDFVVCEINLLDLALGIDQYCTVMGYRVSRKVKTKKILINSVNCYSHILKFICREK